MANSKKVRRLLKAMIKEWQACDVLLLASALAYSTVFALAPLMILIMMMLGALFGETTAKEQIVSQLSDWMGEDAAQLLATAIANLRAQTNQSGLQFILSLSFFTFGASSVFAQIQNSLDRIWEVKPTPGRHIFHFLRKRLLSFAMILAIVFLLLVSSVASTTLSLVVSALNQWLPGAGYLWQILRWVVSFGAISVVFAAIYTILPDANIHWQDTFIGAMLTSLLFIVGQALFGVFLNWVDISSAYGVAGSFLIVITWIFYAAQILFSGAVFTKVYARQRGVPIVPSDFAISTSEQNSR